MYDLVKVAPKLIDVILKYKKKRKIEEISDTLLDYYDETPENFSKILLFGYLEKAIKKKKIKIFVKDFNPNSFDGSSALKKIKEELKTYFHLLIEIISKTNLPIEKEPKKKGLLEEYVKLKKMSSIQFYNICLATLKLPEKKEEFKEDGNHKEEKIAESPEEVKAKDNLSAFLAEEKVTLGYFLISDDLYGEESGNKDYFWEPFYRESFPSDYAEINSRHDKLIKALYPQNSIFKPIEVIKSLISKNFLEIAPGNWSTTGKTYYLSTLSVKDQLEARDAIYRNIIQETSNLVSSLIQSVAKDNKIMSGLYLLEKNVPLEVVVKLIGPECKKLVEFGFNNQDLLRSSWRIIFNAENDRFNMIEGEITKNSLQIINHINEIKQSLLSTLSELEKHYISVFSVGKTTIDKHMGENYTEQTLRKYRAKMGEIELNYSKKLNALIEFTGETKSLFENIHKSLISRGIIWLKSEGFSGYQDVHQEVVKSFLEIEPDSELKENL